MRKTAKALYKVMRLESAHIYDREGKDLCEEFGLFSNSGLGRNLYYADMDLSVK